jgi:hypothetical protein
VDPICKPYTVCTSPPCHVLSVMGVSVCFHAFTGTGYVPCQIVLNWTIHNYVTVNLLINPSHKI